MNNINKKLYEEIEKFNPIDQKEEKDKEVILKYIENNDDVLTRNNEIAHFTTSGWIVNKNRNKVLMIHHNIYNSWAWVGGHADGDNDLRRVILKEIEEETGLNNVKFITNEIYGLNIITVDSHIKRNKQVNSHLHFDIEYLLEANESDTLQVKEDENSGVKWVNIEDVLNTTNEEKMKPIYERLILKLKKY